MEPLIKVLRKVQFRLSVHQWLRWSAKTLFMALIASTFWVIATRLFPQLGEPQPVVLILIPAMILISTLWAIIKRPTLIDAALKTDHHLNLKERLTSSLELADASGPMVDALHADVEKHIKHLNYKKGFPFYTSRGLPWLVLPALILGLSYMLFPEMDLLKQKDRIAEAKVKDEATAVQVERLKSTSKHILEEAQVDTPELRDLTAALGALATDLENAKITDKQAMARLSNLSDDLRKQREAMSQNKPMPKLAGDLNKLNLSKELAAAIQNGNMNEAAKQAKALQEKLKEGNLSEKDRKALKKELKTLSDMLGGSNTTLGQALAKASAAMANGDMKGAMEAMDNAQLSLEDLESIMKQLEAMDVTMMELAEWKQGYLGPSEFCRLCGVKLTQCDGKGGECKAVGHTHGGLCGSCAGNGLGLGGAGRGTGNRLGEIPDVAFGLKPTLATGPLTKGRMLADILQQTAPETGSEATVEYISGAFVQLQQEAEQALTQEQIPAASKEFIRQYFGSLEPEKN